jgi:hypothetical protein
MLDFAWLLTGISSYWIIFMPSIIKCQGHYVMAYASVSVNIWFPSITGQTRGSIDPIFLWLFGDEWRKVTFDDQLRHSSKMAAMPAIFDLVFIDLLTIAWVDWSDFLVAHWGHQSSPCSTSP